MGQSLVSVILPVFNAERYVAPALESVLQQTHDNLQVIVIDDGSTDNSLQIVRAVAAGDARVRIHARENRGLVATLNEALSHCDGEFVARMDADDICRRDRITKQLGYLEEHGLDIVGGAVEIFADDKVIAVKPFPQHNAALKASILCWGGHFCHPAVLARRTLFDRYGYEDFAGIEDFALWIRLALDPSVRMGNLPDVVLRYRDHPKQVTKAEKIDWHRERQRAVMVEQMVRYAGARAELVDAFEQAIRPKKLLLMPWRRRRIEAYIDWLMASERLELEVKAALLAYVRERLVAKRRPRNKTALLGALEHRVRALGLVR